MLPFLLLELSSELEPGLVLLQEPPFTLREPEPSLLEGFFAAASAIFCLFFARSSWALCRITLNGGGGPASTAGTGESQFRDEQLEVLLWSIGVDRPDVLTGVFFGGTDGSFFMVIALTPCSMKALE